MGYQETQKGYPNSENTHFRVCPNLVSHIRTALQNKQVEIREFKLNYPEGNGYISEGVRWYVGAHERLPYNAQGWEEEWDKFARSLFDTEYTDRGEKKVGTLPLGRDEFIKTRRLSCGIQVPQLRLCEYAGLVRSVTREGNITRYNKGTPLHRRLSVVVFPDSKIVNEVSFSNEQDMFLAQGIIANNEIARFWPHKTP